MQLRHKILPDLVREPIGYIYKEIILHSVVLESTTQETTLQTPKSAFMSNKEAFLFRLDRDCLTLLDFANTVDLYKSPKLRVSIFQEYFVSF